MLFVLVIHMSFAHLYTDEFGFAVFNEREHTTNWHLLTPTHCFYSQLLCLWFIFFFVLFLLPSSHKLWRCCDVSWFSWASFGPHGDKPTSKSFIRSPKASLKPPPVRPEPQELQRYYRAASVFLFFPQSIVLALGWQQMILLIINRCN